MKHTLLVFTCLLLMTTTADAAVGMMPAQPRGDDFVLYTQPKTGTHLVIPILVRLARKPTMWNSTVFNGFVYPVDQVTYEAMANSDNHVPVYMFLSPVTTARYQMALNDVKQHGAFFHRHTPYTLTLDLFLQERNYRAFFILRDPRDYCVSAANYFDHANTGMIFDDEELSVQDFDEKLMTIIRGTHWYNSARQIVGEFTRWCESPNCCVVQFEALVSEDDSVRLDELRKMADHINVSVSDEELLQIYDASFGMGPTFREGKTGKWKTAFTEEHKRVFKEELGDLLIELGYEDNDNW